MGMQLLRKITKFVGLPVSITMNVLGYTLDVREVASLGLSSEAWKAIGFGLFIVVILSLVYWQHKDNDSLKKEMAKITERDKDRDIEIKDTKSNGFEYYENRKALKADIDVEFEDTEGAYVLWYTGYGARGHNIHRKGIIKKMILIDPRCCFEEPFQSHIINISKRTPEEVARDIEALTRESQESGVEVRWLASKPQDLIIINNPKTANAWIRIEPFDLTKNARDWRSYRVYKDKQPDLFNTLSDKYVLLWLESKEPDWDTL